MESSNDTGKIIGAALIGALIGAGLGILFAPAKGSDTRKNLLAKGDQLKDSLLNKMDEVKDSLKNGVEVGNTSENL